MPRSRSDTVVQWSGRAVTQWRGGRRHSCAAAQSRSDTVTQWPGRAMTQWRGSLRHSPTVAQSRNDTVTQWFSDTVAGWPLCGRPCSCRPCPGPCPKPCPKLSCCNGPAGCLSRHFSAPQCLLLCQSPLSQPLCMPPRRSRPSLCRWISRQSTAAGVTPEMRPACPRLAGRTLHSFSMTSLERPATFV